MLRCAGPSSCYAFDQSSAVLSWLPDCPDITSCNFCTEPPREVPALRSKLESQLSIAAKLDDYRCRCGNIVIICYNYFVTITTNMIPMSMVFCAHDYYYSLL